MFQPFPFPPFLPNKELEELQEKVKELEERVKKLEKGNEKNYLKKEDSYYMI